VLKFIVTLRKLALNCIVNYSMFEDARCIIMSKFTLGLKMHALE